MITLHQSWVNINERQNLSEEFIEWDGSDIAGPTSWGNNLFKLVCNELPPAAQKMQNRILMRIRRVVLVNKFEHSNEDALRVFANQLDLVKY